MRRLVITIVSCVALLTALVGIGCTTGKENRDRCDAGEYFEMRMTTDPEFRRNNERVQRLIEEYYQTIDRDDESSLRGGRIIIPVVVHVLHNGEAVGTGSNVSDAQVQSQIDVMNRDFRKANADVGTTPAAFLPVTADTRIEFQLAARDPTCAATNGITRQTAGRASFTATQAKSAATGGVDPWDPEKYLNIWVVADLERASGDDILGSSSFPADPLDQQGFVVDFEYLGNIGTGTTHASFNDGRTAVHEFGHFFDLRHIWGDDDDGDGTCEDPAECAGSDLIDDTPNQGERNYGTPTSPLTDCCTTSGDGVMFMNFLDYVDDSAMVMFTKDQADRMVAALYGTKASLIGSDGLLPPPDGGASPDLFMQDTPEDIGDEPNTDSTTFYITEDIWIREGSDGIANQEHENPQYTGAGSTASVYVRVRNRGCADAASQDVRLYWAKASSGLSWPDPWNGGVTVDGALMGDEIGLEPTGTVPSGGYTILEYTWPLPDPADYASFGADRVHFCLLARIGADADMTTPETSDLWNNVRNNNNIVWKNVTVAESTSGGDRTAHGLVGNHQQDDLDVSLRFNVPWGEFSFFDVGDVFVVMPDELLKRWQDQGSVGTDVKVVANDRVQLLKSGATMEQIRLGPGEVFAVQVEFSEQKRRPGPYLYVLDMTQFHGPVASDHPMGGLRFWVKVWNRKGR
jgi:hypothetical protein